MNSSCFFSASPFQFLVITTLLVWLELPISLSNPELYRERQKLFRCGRITAGYPFWGGDRPEGCGHPVLQLQCDNKTNTTSLQIEGVAYHVLGINNSSQTMEIARTDYLHGLCPDQLVNRYLDLMLFHYVDGYRNIAIYYRCQTSSSSVPGNFGCPKMDGFNYVAGGPDVLGTCHDNVSVIVPESLRKYTNKSAVEEALKAGFEVKWKVDNTACERQNASQGICGFDRLDKEICYCPEPSFSDFGGCRSTVPLGTPTETPHPPAATNSTKTQSFTSQTNKWKMAVGIAAGVAAIIMLSIVLTACVKRQYISDKVMIFTKKKTDKDLKTEEFFRKYEHQTPKRYSYSQVKKMTKSFANKLGQGGYGRVYKGELPDGRLVAVKVLTESKSNGEEFINEVASISRTSHVNIVTLLGFCYEKMKRALIYEFMPKGSLDKFIYEQGAQETSGHLEWVTLHEIALGIARGLQYLHGGCNTRILHFDIKPHNILLDENFCPKISDFGLAKLCKRDDSIVSMLGVRGTAGYIAPELFCRNFGGVSHKSDVYSYGMMVLEMVGGRKNIDVRVSRTSEIYFPHWIYEHVQHGEEVGLDGIDTEEEEEMARKMILVSLWCIQTYPSQRPSMNNVVEMLEGSLQSLQLPPKPVLSSPPRSPQQSSTISSSTP